MSINVHGQLQYISKEDSILNFNEYIEVLLKGQSQFSATHPNTDRLTESQLTNAIISKGFSTGRSGPSQSFMTRRFILTVFICLLTPS